MQTSVLAVSHPPRPPSYLFMSGEEERDFEGGSQAGGTPSRGEDLPFRVEVWSKDCTMVDQTLAMTANGSIGYAAYYEATREYPDRYVVLRHKSRIVARWNPPEN